MLPEEFYKQDIKTQLEWIAGDMLRRSREISNSMYEQLPSRSEIIAIDSNKMTAWRYTILQIIKKLNKK